MTAFSPLKTSLRLALAAFLTLSEDGLISLQDGHQRLAVNRFMLGNFAPQPHEAFAPHLPITGTLPTELVGGVYARIGPNPTFIAGNYHWFDGDGYVHAVRLGQDHANYSGSFVQTSRYKQERAAGRALFSKFGDCSGPAAMGHVIIEQLRHLLGILDLSAGWGTANTALVFHNGRLLALHEGDQAYEMHVHGDGRLQTLGRRHVGGADDKAWFTAHPKVDHKTGAMYAFGYSLFWRPYATYYRIDPQGQQTAMVPLPLDYPTMLHDFGLTQGHAIFIQTSMRFRLLHCLRPGRSVFAYDEHAPLRFLVLPRNATSASEGRWFDLPPGVIFHVATAWEEADGSIIRLYVIRFERPFELNVDWMQFSMENAKPQELDEMGAHLWEVVLDLKTGQATQRRLMSSVPQTCEFLQVHPGRVGGKARYVYCTLFYGNSRMQAFAKIDLDIAGEDEAAGVRIIEMEDGAGGGEVAFVPREGAREEDDGYLVLYVHNDYTHESELRVYDAKTMGPLPVSRVPLPQRVPYGFHGTFLSRDALQTQRPLAPESAMHTPSGQDNATLRAHGRDGGEGASIDLTQGRSPRPDSLDRLMETAASWWHAAQTRFTRKRGV